MSQRRPIVIGLVWHQMNSDNLGVGALALANLDILRCAALQAGLDPHFLIMGWRDPRPWYEEPEDVENIPLRTRHLFRPGGPLARAIARCDILFDIGGGDSFTDIYGSKRFITVWITKFRGILAGKPLVLSPQTVGPFNNWWSRFLARMVMNRAQLIMTRDAPSSRFIKELGVKAPQHEATDVAMGLPGGAPRRAETRPVRVGLNVSGLLFNGGYTGKNQFGLKSDYSAMIQRLITWFVARDEIELHLVGHVQSERQPIEDDRRVNLALAEEFPSAKLAPVFNSPIEAKRYISGMDFFVGARMHATIAAFSAGVPVVPTAYSRKFVGVFGSLGYDHYADCVHESADDIIAKITAGYENRAVLAADAAQAMTQTQERLDQYRALASREMAAALDHKQRAPR